MNQLLTCSSGCNSSSAAPVRIGAERARWHLRPKSALGRPSRFGPHREAAITGITTSREPC
jgi:hypothetical protein